MKRLLCVIACLVLWAGVSLAQKGKAEPDYYPMGYPGDTWTGEVTAIDNEQRTLTLTQGSGKKTQTFVASIPDAPYEWVRDLRNARVLDFPYDKRGQYQTYKYDGPGFAATLLPNSEGEGNATGIRKRPNPPASNQITDFADFKGRHLTVYYTPRERKVGGNDVKYNEVWRIRVLSPKK
jgi:hypothetical protein